MVTKMEGKQSHSDHCSKFNAPLSKPNEEGAVTEVEHWINRRPNYFDSDY